MSGFGNVGLKRALTDELITRRGSEEFNPKLVASILLSLCRLEMCTLELWGCLMTKFSLPEDELSEVPKGVIHQFYEVGYLLDNPSH